MNDLRDLERAIGPWLEQHAAARTPDYVDEMLGRVARVKQRPSAIAALLGPRMPGPRFERPLVLLALVGLLIAALVATVVVGGGSPSRGPFGRPVVATFELAATLPWQAEPMSPARDLGAWLDSECIAGTAPAYPSSGVRGRLPGPPRRVLLDVRGEGFVMGLYAAGQLAPDAVGDDFAEYFYGGCYASVAADGGGEVLQAGFAPCAICLRLMGPLLAYPAFDHGRPNEVHGYEDLLPRPLTAMAGRVRPGVARVVIGLSDGQRVEATVGDGWFMAWWPAEGEPHDPAFVPAVRVLAYGTSGELLADAPAPTPEPRSPG